MSGSMAAFGKLGLLYGGLSSEREISLMSGSEVLAALRNLGADVTAIDVQDNLIEQLLEHRIERAFIALHGPGGEDGTVQGALQYLGIPYTGSGVMASALAMDKLRCKQLWRGMGLPTADFAVLQENSDWHGVLEALGGSAVVKPATEGSSMGMSIAQSAEQLHQAWQLASQFDSGVLAESKLEGEEYTVAVLGERPLPSIRIEAASTFYDYQAKYFSDKTQYFCPSGLSDRREGELAELAISAFRSLDCRGWGRVDVMTDSRGDFQILEVNTVPGMTSHSLVPMAARAEGISFDNLVQAILEESL